MLAWLRTRATYANVVSTLCLFMVLGGGAYAATQLPADSVGTKQLRRGAVTSQKIKDHTIVGQDVDKPRLGSVPLAANAAELGGLGRDAYLRSNATIGTANFGTLPAARAEHPSAGKFYDIQPCTLDIAEQPDENEQALHLVDESFDTANLHPTGFQPPDGVGTCAPAANTSRLTAPVAGIYEVSAGVVWAQNATGKRVLALKRNGNSYLAQQEIKANDEATTIENVSTLVKLSASDYVEAVVAQTGNTGGGLTVQNDPRTYLAAAWVAPAQ